MTTPTDTIEATTYYVLYDDGSASLITSTTDEEPPLAKPGQFVDRATYETRAAELRELREDHAAALQAADQQRAQEDYDALLAAGIPEATARRLSGYTPPTPEQGA